MSTEELLNALSRYDSRCKVKNNKKKKISEMKLDKIAQIQNISKNELSKAEKLKKKSIYELKAIARLRRIKNIEKLTNEDLILTLLKSEISVLENNFRINNTNDDDDTYVDKIRGKTSDIRMILSRLGNTIFNKIERKLKKSFMK